MDQEEKGEEEAGLPCVESVIASQHTSAIIFMYNLQPSIELSLAWRCRYWEEETKHTAHNHSYVPEPTTPRPPRAAKPRSTTTLGCPT